ncbi:UTRA domain-containing protein [Sinorhizobium garamanticum]|uniref:UTRA domain-containing protein n=1 Tax=Sinorhizobium garamanticum TaxID=680247 RepID=A0ABY8DBU6_9HYPH|nr:UTRA domain-containing protein [Sinorhizobium garamanticum]WEX87772.1 UTRA domain-containing protein [Sinorhizobium garamanticum]
MSRFDARLASGARIFHSIMVHFESGLPIQIEDRFVNPAICPRYRDFRAITPNAYLTAIAPTTRADR